MASKRGKRKRRIKAQRRRPVTGCYAVGRGRIRRRKVNPWEEFYIFALKGRGWVRYDGEDFTKSRPGRGYPTPNAAWRQVLKLRRQFPYELKNALMYVTSDLWPRIHVN